MTVQRNSRPAPTARHQAASIEILRATIPSAPRARLGVQLWTSAVHAVDAFESHLRRYGLSAGRFGILLTLLAAPEGRLAPSQIAARVGVSRPTITNLGRKLAATGLVELAGRGGLALSETGRSRMQEVATDHFDRLAAALEIFTAEERETLEAALPLVARFCSQLVGAGAAPEEVP